MLPSLIKCNYSITNATSSQSNYHQNVNSSMSQIIRALCKFSNLTLLSHDIQNDHKQFKKCLQFGQIKQPCYVVDRMKLENLVLSNELTKVE